MALDLSNADTHKSINCIRREQLDKRCVWREEAEPCGWTDGRKNVRERRKVGTKEGVKLRLLKTHREETEKAHKGINEDLGGRSEWQALCSYQARKSDTQAALEGNSHSGYISLYFDIKPSSWTVNTSGLSLLPLCIPSLGFCHQNAEMSHWIKSSMAESPAGTLDNHSAHKLGWLH